MWNNISLVYICTIVYKYKYVCMYDHDYDDYDECYDYTFLPVASTTHLHITLLDKYLIYYPLTEIKWNYLFMLMLCMILHGIFVI